MNQRGVKDVLPWIRADFDTILGQRFSKVWLILVGNGSTLRTTCEFTQTDQQNHLAENGTTVHHKTIWISDCGEGVS